MLHRRRWAKQAAQKADGECWGSCGALGDCLSMPLEPRGSYRCKLDSVVPSIHSRQMYVGYFFVIAFIILSILILEILPLLISTLSCEVT